MFVYFEITNVIFIFEIIGNLMFSYISYAYICAKFHNFSINLPFLDGR